jgi:hypothetical protein
MRDESAVNRGSNLGMNEDDGAAVVAPSTAEQELAQTKTERLPMGEPPIDCLATGVDAITSTELDQLRLPKFTLPSGKFVSYKANKGGRRGHVSIKFCTPPTGIAVALP